MVDQSRVRAVFDEALDLAGAERVAYLDETCRNEPEVRARVEALLAAAEREGDFLSSPTSPDGDPDPDATLETPVPMSEEPTVGDLGESRDAVPMSEAPGAWIGPYKLLQLIGEGGFGSVFMAEQREPVQRKVALKIIKLGMDTRQVVARFEQERQALAIMDHLNIARVFDAGVTRTGRPYFVMELCTGEPITSYCDRARLSVRERLALFAQVYQAAQHAHQKGVIYRDIKPSNVLVGTHDEKPHAKVIDFGIAKATANRLTDKTFFTEHRQIIGTPEYMSPEQAEGSLDIDTRTDIYYLGALLYELLTGLTPFDSRSPRSAAYAEIQRIIREVEPPKPSTRLSQSSDALAGFAASRRIEPKKLSSFVRGELDWIVMKALEKDRSRRYETATGLALDIQRYLGGEAVVAAPPNGSYRARKFVRRNKGPVTAAAAVAAALLIGVVAFAWQANLARKQRDLAIAAQVAEVEQRRVADALRELAQLETARAVAMKDFMQRLLTAADPFTTGRPNDMTVKELLSDASEIAGATLANQPLVEAEARTFLGNTLVTVGQVDEGITELDRSIAIRDANGEARSPMQRGAYWALGKAFAARRDYQRAIELLLVACEIGRDHRDTHPGEVALDLLDLANSYMETSRFDEAERAVEEAETILDTAGLEPLQALAYASSVRSGIARQRDDNIDAAEAFTEQEVELRRRAEDHVQMLFALNNIAVMKMTRGKLDETEAMFREMIGLSTQTHSRMNQRTAMFIENLANVQYRRGDYAGSFDSLAEVSEIRDAVLGPESLAAAQTRQHRYRRDQSRRAREGAGTARQRCGDLSDRALR